MARDKQIGLKFEAVDVERWDAWAAEHGFTRTTMIEAAMARLMAEPAPPAPPAPVALHRGARDRRAYICEHERCVPPRRIFLRSDEPGRVPDCPDGHGPMARQENRSYFGQPT